MIDNDYGMARQNAKEILIYAWNVFDEKTTQIFDNLAQKPLSEAMPIGENSKEIDIDQVILRLKDVKNQMFEEFNKINQNVLFDEKLNEYVDEDLEWIDNRIKNAKKIGVNWFQSFVIKKGLPHYKYESIKFLWDNFCYQNLWIRYNNEPNFIECKDKGQIVDWYKTNNSHLLSCYHEAVYTIVQMRNIAEHLETNHYAKSFLKKLNESVKDPITNLDKSLFNSYTYFTSMTNMITGLLRSLQIFVESVKISLTDGIDESELPTNTEYNIECPKCNTVNIMPFEPDVGRKIKCFTCKKNFVFKDEYIKKTT